MQRRKYLFSRLTLASAAVCLSTLIGCQGSGPTGVPGGPPPPAPMGGLCICPGLPGRPFAGCPREPVNGDVALWFECPSSSAVFQGQCQFEVSSSQPLIAALSPVIVSVPPTPPGQTTERVFTTVANEPGGFTQVFARDIASGFVISFGTLQVSTNCQ